MGAAHNLTTGSTCPIDQLPWLANATLLPDERGALEAHLGECPACRARLEEWTTIHGRLREVFDLTTSPPSDLFALVERALDEGTQRPSSRVRANIDAVHGTLRRQLEVGADHLRAQARLVRRDLFWLPAIVLAVVGALVYLPETAKQAPQAAALVAGWVTALSMAVLTGRAGDPGRELALATPTSVRMTLGIRCVLVLGYDLALNAALVLPLLLTRGTVTPAWLVTGWLAPLCFLSGVALLTGVLRDTATAVGICGLLWGLRVLGGVQRLLLGSAPLPTAGWQRGYAAFWHQSPLLFAIAGLALLLAFATVERGGELAR